MRTFIKIKYYTANGMLFLELYKADFTIHFIIFFGYLKYFFSVFVYEQGNIFRISVDFWPGGGGLEKNIRTIDKESVHLI